MLHRMGRRLGAIALLAMLVRAVVPAGFMLAEAQGASGRYLTVTVCEGHGPAQMVDLDTGKVIDPSQIPSDPDGAKKPSPAPCVFAGTAPMAGPVATIELVEFVVAHDADFGVVRDVRPGRGIAAPPPPSTGPPSAI